MKKLGEVENLKLRVQKLRYQKPAMSVEINVIIAVIVPEISVTLLDYIGNRFISLTTLSKLNSFKIMRFTT